MTRLTLSASNHRSLVMVVVMVVLQQFVHAEVQSVKMNFEDEIRELKTQVRELLAFENDISEDDQSEEVNLKAEINGLKRQIKTVLASQKKAEKGDVKILQNAGMHSKRLISQEETLLSRLFDGYNPTARPVLRSTNAVQVQIKFSLLHIQELNLKSQTLTTSGLLILDWIDERLSWNASEYHQNEIVVEARKLWRPEFASINGANGIHGDHEQFRALVGHTGRVHWEPGGVFRTVCKVNISYYPFDEQYCRLVFGAWTYNTDMMNLSTIDDNVNLDSFDKNGEWDIYSTKAIRREFAFACCPGEKFANVEFVLLLRRRPMFYVLNVILPSMMTSVLLLSVFYCPPGFKVPIGVVVLLSFRIFMLNVADSIPKTSDHVPLLGIYLTCTMAMTTLMMVQTVFVLNIYNKKDCPVPAWLHHIVFYYLAVMLCMRRGTVRLSCSNTSHDHRLHQQHSMKSQMNGTQPNSQNSCRPSLIATLENAASDRTPGETHSLLVKQAALTEQPMSLDGMAKDAAKAAVPATERAVTGGPDMWAKDWYYVAEVMDRVFFWLFLIATVLISVMLFHPLLKNISG